MSKYFIFNENKSDRVVRHDSYNNEIKLYIQFSLSFQMTIYIYIYHLHCTDFGALGVAQKIQVIGSLQDDELFTISSWIWVIYLRL